MCSTTRSGFILTGKPCLAKSSKVFQEFEKQRAKPSGVSAINYAETLYIFCFLKSRPGGECFLFLKKGEELAFYNKEDRQQQIGVRWQCAGHLIHKCVLIINPDNITPDGRRTRRNRIHPILFGSDSRSHWTVHRARTHMHTHCTIILNSGF